MSGLFSFKKAWFILSIGGLSVSAAIAQDSKADKKAAQEAAITKIITDQDYVFTAQTVTPTGGRYRNLTTTYTVKVSKDTVKSDMPYFGRAYSAPISSTDGGIKFTSTNFDYKLTEKKKGSWDVLIKPKDVSDVQQFTMTIFNNGTASLQVTSTNRQPISFNGYVDAPKKKKDK